MNNTFLVSIHKTHKEWNIFCTLPIFNFNVSLCILTLSIACNAMRSFKYLSHIFLKKQTISPFSFFWWRPVIVSFSETYHQVAVWTVYVFTLGLERAFVQMQKNILKIPFFWECVSPAWLSCSEGFQKQWRDSKCLLSSEPAVAT